MFSFCIQFNMLSFLNMVLGCLHESCCQQEVFIGSLSSVFFSWNHTWSLRSLYMMQVINCSKLHSGTSSSSTPTKTSSFNKEWTSDEQSINSKEPFTELTWDLLWCTHANENYFKSSVHLFLNKQLRLRKNVAMNTYLLPLSTTFSHSLNIMSKTFLALVQHSQNWQPFQLLHATTLASPKIFFTQLVLAHLSFSSPWPHPWIFPMHPRYHPLWESLL